MFELRISVKKVMGRCTADPPMKPGGYFTVSDGDIRMPEGGYICMWALQSLMPLITPKEREIAEAKEEDWMWRVHHVQCPDPDGRVIFKIERTGKVHPGVEPVREAGAVPPIPEDNDGACAAANPASLRVSVDSVNGECTSRMKPGDSLVLHGGRLCFPAGTPFCLYALQAALPLLPAKQRRLQDGDWLKAADRVLCPDPAGNVILKIDRIGND